MTSVFNPADGGILPELVLIVAIAAAAIAWVELLFAKPLAPHRLRHYFRVRRLFVLLTLFAGSAAVALIAFTTWHRTGNPWYGTGAFAASFLVLLTLRISVFGRYEDAPVHWDCHACTKRLASNVPWICGGCDGENHRRSLLAKCEHCNAQATGLVCYYPTCGQVNFFSRRNDPRRIAKRVPQPLPGETDAEARVRRQREVEERKHDIERLELEAKVRDLESRLQRFNPPPKPDPAESRSRQLDRVLTLLHVDMKAVMQSKEIQDKLIREIRTNAGGLPTEEVDELITYAQGRFKGFRDDIRLGQFDQ